MSAYGRINNAARCVLKPLAEYVPLDLESRHALVLVALLPILSTGCSTSRHRIAGGFSTSKPHESLVADGELEGGRSEQVATAIRPVACRIQLRVDAGRVSGRSGRARGHEAAVGSAGGGLRPPIEHNRS